MMVFNESPRFPCDVCGERREDFHLVVNSKQVIVKEAIAEQSEPVYGAGITVRFCTDKQKCAERAAQRIKDHIAKEKADYGG